MQHYQLGTAEVASDIALPGLVPSRGDAAAATIIIQRGLPGVEASDWISHPAGAESTPDWAAVDHLCSSDGGWFRIRYDYHGHIADFSIRADGRRITVHAGENETDAEVANLIEGPILGRAMRLAGAPCLHATALAENGVAIALMGASGVGKSSLAWALVQRGCRLLTDDMVGFSHVDGAVMVQPGRARLRIWPDVAERLGIHGGDSRVLFPTAQEMAKIGVRDDTAFEDSPVPLRAIYRVLPRDRSLRAPRIAASPAGERLAELAANLHGVIAPPKDARRRELALLARVAAAVPLYTIALPDDLTLLPDVAAELRQRLFA